MGQTADLDGMPQGLSAQEEQAFAAIIRDLEPDRPTVGLWHLVGSFVAWLAGWIGLVSFVEPLAAAAACFLVIVASSAAALFVIRQVTVKTEGWDRSLNWGSRMKLAWSNLRP